MVTKKPINSKINCELLDLIVLFDFLHTQSMIPFQQAAILWYFLCGIARRSLGWIHAGSAKGDSVVVNERDSGNTGSITIKLYTKLCWSVSTPKSEKDVSDTCFNCYLRPFDILVSNYISIKEKCEYI